MDIRESQWLKEIMQKALIASFRVHEELGEQGRERMPKDPNQFGDASLILDFEAEEAVLDSLRACGISIRVFSEEHGMMEIGNAPYVYTGFLDGIDGSWLLQRGLSGYATMFGIFKGEDPTYDDACISGIMEHATWQMYLAVRGGSAVVEVKGTPIPLHTSLCKTLTVTTRIQTDLYTPLEQRVYREKFEGKFLHVVTDTHCAAVSYTSFLLGNADAMVEAIMEKKQDLEKLVAYLFIIEAGGTVIDSSGEHLENKKCLMPEAGERLIIAASSVMLAKEIRNYLAL